MKKIDSNKLSNIVGGISGGECALLGAAVVSAMAFSSLVALAYKKELSACWNS